MTRASESGQVTVLVLGIALMVFAVSGIAVDGTKAWLYRRTLQNTADASALAGAAELSRDFYYRSGGKVARLDAASARRVAAQWIADSGHDVRAGLVVDPEGVEVALLGRSPTLFLRLIGVREVVVAVQARAEPRRGAP